MKYLVQSRRFTGIWIQVCGRFRLIRLLVCCCNFSTTRYCVLSLGWFFRLTTSWFRRKVLIGSDCSFSSCSMNTVLSCPVVPAFFNCFAGSCLFFTRSIYSPVASLPCYLRVALSIHPNFPVFFVAVVFLLRLAHNTPSCYERRNNSQY